MSTDKSKRRQSLLKAETLSVDLLKKTIDVCSSKNNFPIRKKWAIPSDLYLEAREFTVNLQEANNTKVVDKKTAETRLEYDRRASEHIERYIILQNIAVLAYPLGAQVIDSWDTILFDACDMFQKWYNAEKKRYREYVINEG